LRRTAGLDGVFLYLRGQSQISLWVREECGANSPLGSIILKDEPIHTNVHRAKGQILQILKDAKADFSAGETKFQTGS
jgi:hypothetical protein